MRLDERLRFALPSLGLPDERRGPNRGSQLSEVERDPYQWILRTFASVWRRPRLICDERADEATRLELGSRVTMASVTPACN